MAEMSLALILSAQNLISPVINQVAQSLGPLGGGFAAAANAAVGFGEQAVTSAAGYQQAMLKNVALAGLSKDSYQSMSDKILALSPQLGVAPQALANSLYNILSAGVPAANALDVMTLSSEAAATGMTDASVITDGLTSAMNAMSIPFSKTANVMADLTATVSGGKMTWQNLASSIVMLAVTAHEAHISLQDATAGLATMTDSGMSANRAGMDLDFLMRDLGMNVDKVAANAKKMGVSFDEGTFKTMGLMDKLRYLQQVTGGNASEMMKLTGGATGMAAAQAILTNNGQLYAGILGNVSKAYQQGTMTQESFKTTQQGLNQQLAQLNAAWQVLLITVGNVFLPLVTKLVVFITPLVQDFATWITRSQLLTMGMRDVGGILAPLLPLVQDVQGAFTALDPAMQNTATVSTTLVNGFGQVVHAMVPVSAATNPLLDTFDRASAIFPRVAPPLTNIAGAAQRAAVALAPLADSFNRATIATSALPYNLTRTATALAPMSDSFNRASTIIPTTTVTLVKHQAALQNTTAATNPLIAAWQGLVAYVQGELGPVLAGFPAALAPVMPELTALWNGIVTVTKTVLGLLIEVIGNVLASTVQGFQGAFQIIINLVAFFVDLFTLNFGKLGPDLLGVLGGIKNIFIGFFSALLGQAPQWGAGIVNGIISGIASAIPAIGHVMGQLLGALTPTPQKPSIPHFAGGVSNFGGGLAVVGEQGPELVYLPGGSSVVPGGASTPLARSPSGGGSHVFAPQIVINVPPGRLDQASAKQIAQEVNQYLSQQFLRSGVVLPTFKGV
jgi:TP901 family phage tail tape measure protein